MTALAVRNQGAGRPRSRMYRVARQIADRFERPVALAFLAAIAQIRERIDREALVSAVVSGDANAIRAALATGGDLGGLILSGPVEQEIRRTLQATGRASADVLAGVLRESVAFDVADPAAILWARERAARLVVAVTESQREAVAIVVAVAQAQGLTAQQQARAIRQVVGLPPQWAATPTNLRRQILEGDESGALDRRLSATDQAQIRSRIRRGTVTEEFADAMSERYAASLRNLRGLTIARTETMTAANRGLRLSWQQAQRQRVLPRSARRVVIVTPDNRLRAEHLEAGIMNRQGVPLDAPFRTPWGLLEGPPWEPDPYNCRCSEGLIFPGREGVL